MDVQFVLQQCVLLAHHLKLALKPLHLRPTRLQVLIFGHQLLVKNIPEIPSFAINLP